MDRLLQFYQPNYNIFPITNQMQFPISTMPVSSIADDNNNDFQELICDGKKHIKCTFPGCGKIYRFKSEFIRHKIIHTSERTLTCPFKGCTKAFKREDILRNHIRTHTGETPFKCQEPGCGKSFPCHAGLKYHSLKHKGEKEFRCSFPGCNRTFLIMSQLKQHESTLNYHHKLSNLNLSHENEEEYNINATKLLKSEDTSSTGSETKQEEMAGWGVKLRSENVQNEKTDGNIDQEFKRMMYALVAENNAMKMKLNMLYSGRGLIPENIKVESNCSIASASDINKLRHLLAQQLPGERTFAFTQAR